MEAISPLPGLLSPWFLCVEDGIIRTQDPDAMYVHYDLDVIDSKMFQWKD
jgi:hypothetical protein